MPDKGFTASQDGLNMPFSIEAEQAVLGSVLIDPEVLSTVLTLVRSEYFYLPQHRAIFDVLVSLDTLGSKIDALIVLERLKENGSFDDAAGKNYLVQLAQAVPSTANIENYCKIVKDKFYLRTLISVSRDTIEDATSGSLEADKILDAAEQRIYDIRKGKTSGGFQRLSDVISNEVYPTLHNITSENAEEYKGIPTGFSKLDEMISGLNRSDLILIGARPAMGKTSFALNIARNVAMRGKRTVFFSLEMSNEQLASRVLSTEARVESNKLRSGNISQEEWMRIAEATALLSSCELYFDDTSTITVPEMKAKIRRMKNVDCIIVDYLGLMQSAKKSENRVQEVTEITRSLKLLAKDLKIPVVVCCQLSRGPEKNGKASNRPSLSDLRDSGSIEQDADIVLMLYREGYYKNDKKDAEDVDMTKADVDIAKNRHGPTDRVKLHWDAQYTLFSTLVEYGDEP
ncbi:MAG: replicative DNA helicase [Oscillospiraceae bacterium]|nr:replicative DNA helicase [Oscillospiraceae bacterium]MDY2678286.1 replicative DNA helicase [Oscillospiraceae bacterium]